MARKYEYIEERKSSYRVHLPYNDENGKRSFYTKSFSFERYGNKIKALEHAVKYRDSKKNEIRNNRIIKEKHYTLDEMLNKTLDVYQGTINTQDKYKAVYNKYIKSYFGGEMDFAKIKYEHIQKSLNAMTTLATNDTIGRVKTLWERMFRVAIINKYVSSDESIYIKAPKSEMVVIKKPMETSFEEMLEAIEAIGKLSVNDRDKFLAQSALIVMYFTGMRNAEVCALNKKYIFFDKRQIYVCESVGSTSKEQIAIKTTKTQSSIRYIPMANELIKPLEQLILQANGNDYLFVRDNGKMMTGEKISEICRKATHGEFRPYQLRHQFSTDLLLSGTDIRTIQELMGHTSSTMTVSYARSNNDMKMLAVENRKKNQNNN